MAKIVDGLMEKSETSNFFYILVGLLILVSMLFVLGGDEGLPFTLGRIVSFIIVIVIAYNLIEWTSEITEEPEEWGGKDTLDEEINLRVKDISKLLERASEGKEKSQEIFHERLKRIFFLRFKEDMGLTDEELKDLINKPGEFRDLVRDDLIADFILATEDKEGYEKVDFFSASGLSGKKRYKKKIKDVIKSMNRWEGK